MTDPAKSPASKAIDADEQPVLKKDMKSAFKSNEIFTMVTAVIAAGFGLIIGYTIFVDKAEAAGRKAAEAVAKRQDVLEENQKEVHADMQAMYQAVMYRQPQERFERQVPLRSLEPFDGGL